MIWGHSLHATPVFSSASCFPEDLTLCWLFSLIMASHLMGWPRGGFHVVHRVEKRGSENTTKPRRNYSGEALPTIMNELYQGTLDKDNVETAIEELKKIQLELQAFSPDKVVWDIDDLSNQPPWGKNISNDITNLSNYFVTSDGEDFITIFFNALEKAKKMQMDLTIESV